MLTSRRALLLDMDGVVLHPQLPALRVVANKAVRFVSTVLDVPLARAERINERLYKEFSHTLIGLRRVYGIPQREREFAEFVYDRYSMVRLEHGCMTDKATRQRGLEVASLLQRCRARDVPVYIFSNAPSRWCLLALDALRLLNDKVGISEDRVMGSDHAVFDAGGRRDVDGRTSMMLKPHEPVYNAVERFVRHSWRTSDIDLMFVDDSFKNLVPVIGRPQWRALHFVERPHAADAVTDINTRALQSVFSLADVATVVEDGANPLF